MTTTAKPKKQKLTPKQRLVLMAAVNKGGVVNGNMAAYAEIQALRFLGLLIAEPEFTKGQVDQKIKLAWKSAASAARNRDLNALDGAVKTLRDEKWLREKEITVITLKGRELIADERV
jgi:hypothetical protein